MKYHQKKFKKQIFRALALWEWQVTPDSIKTKSSFSHCPCCQSTPWQAQVKLEALIEDDHLGDWSTEKDCCWGLTFLQVKWLDSEDGFFSACWKVSHQQQSFSGLRTPVTQMITFNQGMLLLDSDYFPKTWPIKRFCPYCCPVILSWLQKLLPQNLIYFRKQHLEYHNEDIFLLHIFTFLITFSPTLSYNYYYLNIVQDRKSVV